MNYSNSDIARSAQRMIAEHGRDASRKAEVRADWLDKVGALAAAGSWRLIAGRCRDLLKAVGAQ
jgi:hypothetical protein